jgi:hypothetical protein
MTQGFKQGITKTIRDAVETSDGFVSTLAALETTPDLYKNHELHLTEFAYMGYTALTPKGAQFPLLRAFVRRPVLARRETELLHKSPTCNQPKT